MGREAWLALMKVVKIIEEEFWLRTHRLLAN
jgi:hypothetical protein